MATTINEKLGDMESRLQRIIEIAENLKLRSEEGEPLSKQQRYEERKSKSLSENAAVAPDVRLKRFLYIGSEIPLYQPGDLEYKLVRSLVPSVEEMIKLYQEPRKKQEKPEKHTEEDIPVLVAISQALMDKNNAYPECAIFALAMCIRSSQAEDGLKEAAYSVARRCLTSFHELTTFIKHATAMHRSSAKEGKSSGGWGGGMRRLVIQWYNKQEPVQLARSVAHHVKSHLWSHKDLMKLTHFKPADTEIAMRAIVCYVLRGLTETEKQFGAETKAAEVLREFRQRKLEIEAGKEEFCKLVETRKLTLSDVPTPQLDKFEVWCAALNNMSTVDVLTVMPSILRLHFPDAEKVRDTAAAMLSKEGATAPPAHVLITLKDYQKSLKNKGHKFDSSYIQERKLKETFPVRDACTKSVNALNTLLASSIKAIEGAGVKTLVTVDLRPIDVTCQWTHSVSPLEASALVSVCLARNNKSFLLTVLTEEGKVPQEVPVEETATFETILEEFKKLQASAKKEPAMTEPIDWAKEHKSEYDVFVVLTPSLKGWMWKENNIARSMAQYREAVGKPNAKLAVCAFGNMAMQVANSKMTGAVDFAGFHSITLPVLNSFCQGSF